MSRALALSAIALALAIAGCGSDDSGETTAPPPSIPAVTAPQLTTTPPATTTAPGTTSTGKGGNFNPSEPDSETNDVPPPAGSPQEAFEKQCEQNPQACG